MSSKVILCILDGFALGDQKKNSNPVKDIPNLQKILAENPHTFLHASEKFVGLDDGRIGNSEVGHTIIGSGTVPMQDLMMINEQINNIKNNDSIVNAMDFARKNNSNIHIISLYSNGGVHSHKNHIEKLATIFNNAEIPVNLHIITDGRDVAIDEFNECDFDNLQDFTNKCKYVKISSIMGRFYAMDRDGKIDRTKLATDAIIFGKGENLHKILDIKKITEADEFIKPKIVKEYCGIKENDIVIFANFRSDRMKQIVQVFTGENALYDKLPNMKICCMMKYYNDLDVDTLFKKDTPKTCLSEILSNHGKLQLKIAETEKYAHITYFFNGNVEKPFKYEDRILINSPDVKAYNEKPEMSLPQLQNVLFEHIASRKYDFIAINIANGDMVGHAGDLDASKLAVKYIDDFIGRLSATSTENDYVLLITADHGNIEESLDENNKPHTKHTLSPVFFIAINCKKKLTFFDNATLANIAPTILDLMSLPKDIKMHKSFL